MPKAGKNTTQKRPAKKAVAKRGRPEATIDIDALLALAKIQATQEEMAAVLGVSRPTLSLFIKDNPDIEAKVDAELAAGKISLRRAQFKSAIAKGNVVMQMFLGKNWLEQSDKVEVKEVDPLAAIVDGLSLEEIEEILGIDKLKEKAGLDGRSTETATKDKA